ncbi:MAG: GNAT family N-acetyltransferase [Chromatiaceae bacterium]|nr:GNAT family N-acetyltransferase [Chromatiaceae bacterium]
MVDHVALVAVLEEQGRPLLVGGGRYIVTRPGYAEIAFGVVDAHQGLGIASLLFKHLLAIARTTGLQELQADVLPGNTAMLQVFRKLGNAVTITAGPDAVHAAVRC